MQDVIVIGAGLSGLTAAVTLHRAGAQVQVVEAAPRIGGRIQTVRDPVSGDALGDLGPTWVWPKYQPVVSAWIKELNLKTFEQFNDGAAVIAGYGPTLQRQPLPAQDGMRRIAGGPQAMIDALRDRLPPDMIRTAAPVTAITKGPPPHIAVTLASGEVITAQNVILATPLRIAARLHLPWATSELLEALRATPTWMATHAKAVALFKAPIWRHAGLSGRIASRIGPLVEAHDHTAADTAGTDTTGTDTASAAIFGFVGWSPEARQRDPDGLRHAILDQLTQCFGPDATPDTLVIQDWANQSYITTELDRTHPATGHDIGPDILRQAHLERRLRFAASEASDQSPGLIEGALARGQTAAADLIADQT